MKHFSRQELARMNGDNGAQTLVAVDGKVYDVSSSKKWLRGIHMNRHHGGMDLSKDIRSAPHALDVLDRFEVVGTLEESASVVHSGFRGRVEQWLTVYPFFRRHPHPAAVHFPLGLFLVVPLLQIIAFRTHSPCTEWAGCCCLGLGLAAMPAVMATGYVTWWLNYECHEFPTIRQKRYLGWLAFCLALLALVVRASFVQDPLQPSESSVIGYVLISWVLAGVIGRVGFLGGKLTFPYEHHDSPVHGR